jgi:ferredoxin
MTYVICAPCSEIKDGTCTHVCPVDCIYTDDDSSQYFINPDECIDCGACEPVCPVSAIFPAEKVPQRWQESIGVNAAYFEK